ncbi:uncharacterized protein LOC124706002 [Lolium rigidum]|uniref:uncharacterized protein LOC124706002 n=1 Tax=Lolium rigidum TaxID=89674 RepID=UPI001F5DDDA0|nr:uncharacterized protein LOC124706002 [Lolium rigidum]
MDQELQEADVLWPPNNTEHHSANDDDSTSNEGDVARVSSPELSAPVAVPPPRKRRSRSWRASDQPFTDGTSGDDGDVVCTNDVKRNVPPHVLAERRRRLAGRSTAAYSMCAGKGRTLKGRDLRNIRNLVLKMTGFIEK